MRRRQAATSGVQSVSDRPDPSDSAPSRPHSGHATGGICASMPDDWAWLSGVVSQSYAPQARAHHEHAWRAFEWLANRAGYVRLPIGQTPYWDRFTPNNEAAINASLGDLMDAETEEFIEARVRLWGGKDECDGMFHCKRELRFEPFEADGEPFMASADMAPVEVGVTSATTTLKHLERARCLVRWPYDDDYLTVIVMRPGAKTFGDEFVSRLMGGRNG